MCIDIGFEIEAAKLVESQVRFLHIQYQDEIPAKFIKVRCPCLNLVLMRYAYKCLYCSVFYCKECAEQHFGKTVEEYKTEKAALLCAIGD